MSDGRFRWLAWATALCAYLQVALGGVVRVSGSGLGCENDWPLCQGRLLPPLEYHAILEYAHRTVGSLTGLLVIATVVFAWARYRRRAPLVAWLATGALAAIVVEGLVGAVVVFRDLAAWLVLVHMALAMVIVGCLVGAAVFALPEAPGAGPGQRRLLALAAALTFLMVLTGTTVVASEADAACHSWPLCGGGLQLDFTGVNAYTMLHRLTVGLAGLVVIVALLAGLRAPAGRPVRWAAAATLLLLLVQSLAVGIGAALTHGDALWNGLHVAIATAVWLGAIAAALLAAPRPAPAAS